MRAVIQEVGMVEKTQSKKTYINVKVENAWYKIIGDPEGILSGVTIEFDPKPFGKSMWAQEFNIIETPKPKLTSHNGVGIAFWDYMDAMKVAHRIASLLEPDDGQARAALVDTCLIAVTTGRVQLPPEGEPEDSSPSDDKDVPF